MKYFSVIKNSFVVLAFLLINSAGFAGHASAMTTTAHNTTVHKMGTMTHGSSDANSCAVQCRTAVLIKDTDNVRQGEGEEDDEDDEDQTVVPFYAVVTNWNFSEKLIKQRQYADTIKPPPKMPLYIRYAVFRV